MIKRLSKYPFKQEHYPATKLRIRIILLMLDNIIIFIFKKILPGAEILNYEAPWQLKQPETVLSLHVTQE